MRDYQELTGLPLELRRDWRAQLHKAMPTERGVFRLVYIRKTQPKSYEELRLVVEVIDENGFPMAGIKMAFSYSTANPFLVDENFMWTPPHPFRGDIFPTNGNGRIEHICGSTVAPGEPGGITMYPIEPEYASDYVSGLGCLGDHTGLLLVFQLQRAGVRSLGQRLAEIETRLTNLEQSH